MAITHTNSVNVLRSDKKSKQSDPPDEVKLKISVANVKKCKYDVWPVALKDRGGSEQPIRDTIEPGLILKLGKTEAGKSWRMFFG